MRHQVLAVIPFYLGLSGLALGHIAQVELKRDQKARTVTVRLVIPDHIHPNQSAPWSFQLGPKKFERDLLNPNLENFTLPAPPSSLGASYKLVAYLCSNDKAHCYREVHEGKLP